MEALAAGRPLDWIFTDCSSVAETRQKRGFTRRRPATEISTLRYQHIKTVCICANTSRCSRCSRPGALL